MSNFDTVINIVKNELIGSEVSLYDLGGGNHLRIEVVSDKFTGKSLIQQHKMIHEILDNMMESKGGFIHALSIKTSIPQN